MQHPIRPGFEVSPPVTAREIRRRAGAHRHIGLRCGECLSLYWREPRAVKRFAPEVLTNPSGFAGIDGLFRFRPDGTNERGLAVMRVTSGGGQPVAGSPKSFGA